MKMPMNDNFHTYHRTKDRLESSHSGTMDKDRVDTVKLADNTAYKALHMALERHNEDSAHSVYKVHCCT